MKRTFIALKIPLNKQSLEIISDIKKELSQEKIKWVESWNMHITISFLGDTEEIEINNISKKLNEDLDKLKSFKLEINELGIFKSTRDPKVILLKINESYQLKELKDTIDNVISSFGFKLEKREFKPHLTLGRIRFIKDKANLNSVIESFKNSFFEEVKIEKVTFYESILTQKGPIYKILSEVKLN